MSLSNKKRGSHSVFGRTEDDYQSVKQSQGLQG